jgi:hypothetical protein
MLKETKYHLEIRSVGTDSESNLHKAVSELLILFNRDKIYHRHAAYVSLPEGHPDSEFCLDMHITYYIVYMNKHQYNYTMKNYYIVIIGVLLWSSMILWLLL